MSDELSQKVYKWLNQSGFPLEMRVARRILRSPLFDTWAVQSNDHYVDPSRDTVREIDLQACLLVQHTQAQITASVWVQLVVECKSTSNPWVIFTDPEGEDRAKDRAVDFHSARRIWRYNSSVKHLRSFALQLQAHSMDPTFRRYSTGHGIVEAFKPPNAKDSAYSATQQVVAASLHVGYNDYFYSTESFEILSVVPVVVTTSPLFEAFIEAGSDRLSCVPVQQSAVLVPDSTSHPRLVLVVCEGALDALLADLEAFSGRANDFLKKCDLTEFLPDNNSRD